MSPAPCPPPVPSNATNILQLSNNMLATNGASICQMWATTPVPTTATVTASVMLVAPQYIGHFPWFLVKSPIIDFARSLQPTQTERAFALTWNDQYMVYCRDQVDTTCVYPFGAEMLLDAFIKFRIPAQIPLGIKRRIEEGIVQECYHPGDSSSPEGPQYINQAAATPSKTAPHVPSSVISSDSQGSSPVVAYVNRANSPIRLPTPMPVQEGPCPINANTQPAADALPTLSNTKPVADTFLTPSTIGDGCMDHKNVVSHKKRKHDAV
ncbi:hypothetical protein PISMIDRAFT_25651 [Pisolithus microcarpus 441]|uniref:Uncharacterized protein n=1 Tax=Pisolithus microcarpus 441 TaxID=765257 RepID=A0A0C9XJL9_9AGAM|nr:hypothetical protein BKA83DRAFT_25651 [Pisolithus microcarpus]KIK12475.1 hypothetical protein PISMIDRAFT_25651 [Pisolithus microcarpus 441]